LKEEGASMGLHICECKGCCCWTCTLKLCKSKGFAFFCASLPCTPDLHYSQLWFSPHSLAFAFCHGKKMSFSEIRVLEKVPCHLLLTCIIPNCGFLHTLWPLHFFKEEKCLSWKLDFWRKFPAIYF
jgi:hypothetical protein